MPVCSGAPGWRSKLGLGATLALAIARSGCAAYPNRLSECEPWKAGDLGYMQSGTLANGDGGLCTISVDPPVILAGKSHTVTVEASFPALFKLHSSDGQCLGREYSYDQATKSKSFEWVAPSSGSVELYALCGKDYTSVYAAPSRRLAVMQRMQGVGEADAPVVAPVAVPAVPEAPESPEVVTVPTPKAAAAQAIEPLNATTVPVAAAAGIELKSLRGHGQMSLSFSSAGVDSIRIEVSLEMEAWLGVGISSGTEMSMTALGEGSDVVLCTEGEVRRYWLTEYDLPSDFEEVPGATCAMANGRTTMTFIRTLAAENDRQRAITPGVSQQLIFAHGRDVYLNPQTVQYHGRDRGGVSIDFGGTSTSELQRARHRMRTPLAFHIIFMSLAWGITIPIGVGIASCMRKGAWFQYHRLWQSMGLALAFFGFLMAYWYVQATGTHFEFTHTKVGAVVLLLGILQPILAALRPPVEPKTAGRIAFQVAHRGFGYVAMIGGICNIWLGIELLESLQFDSLSVNLSTALAAVCMAVINIFVVMKVFCPHRWPLARIYSVKTLTEDGREAIDSEESESEEEESAVE